MKINSRKDLLMTNQVLEVKKAENKELEVKLLLLQNKYQDKLIKIKSYQKQISQLATEWQELYQNFFQNGSLSKVEEILGYLNFSKNLECRVKANKEKIGNEITELQNELEKVEKEYNCSSVQLKYLNKMVKDFQITLNAFVELKQQELFTEKYIRENYC